MQSNLKHQDESLLSSFAFKMGDELAQSALRLCHNHTTLQRLQQVWDAENLNFIDVLKLLYVVLPNILHCIKLK